MVVLVMVHATSYRSGMPRQGDTQRQRVKYNLIQSARVLHIVAVLLFVSPGWRGVYRHFVVGVQAIEDAPTIAPRSLGI